MTDDQDQARPVQNISEAHTPQAQGSPPAQLPPIPADALIILPMRNTVLFPSAVFPIAVGRPGSIAAAQEAVRRQAQIGMVMQRDAEVSEPAPTDLHRIGTVANILRYVTAPDGTHHVVVQGEERFHIVEFLDGWPFLVARILRLAEPKERGAAIEARFLHLQRQAMEALELLPQAPPEMQAAIRAIAEPGTLADVTAALLDIKPEEKQEILETLDLEARMTRSRPS